MWDRPKRFMQPLPTQWRTNAVKATGYLKLPACGSQRWLQRNPKFALHLWWLFISLPPMRKGMRTTEGGEKKSESEVGRGRGRDAEWATERQTEGQKICHDWNGKSTLVIKTAASLYILFSGIRGHFRTSVPVHPFWTRIFSTYFAATAVTLI